MTLAEAARYFTRESRSLACMSVACGTAERALTAEDLCDADSIFDIASLSKLFTGLTAMRLWERGELRPELPVTAYAPRFTRLGDVTVERLLGFETGLRTPERIDAQPDAASAEAMLFACAPVPNGENRAYSDIHAMVARYVLEGASGLPLADLVRREITDPLGLTETDCRVPEEKRARCVSCDREHRIEGGRYLIREGVTPGTPHDPKARILAPGGEVFCGHAGLFSTRADLIRLCQGILRGEVVRPETLRFMARNRTGFRRKDGGWTQFLGILCYVKHPVQYHSEVPAYMSAQALALSGFAGCHLAVDPALGIFEFYLGSRVRDRLSVLIPEAGKTPADYGLAPDGTGTVLWPDGERVISSVDYVHLKDRHYHPAAAQALGLDPDRPPA